MTVMMTATINFIYIFTRLIQQTLRSQEHITLKQEMLTIKCDYVSSMTMCCFWALSHRRVVYGVQIVGAGNTRSKTLCQTLPLIWERSSAAPEKVYCRSRTWCSVTHLPRKLNTSSWAPDDDLYWCQRGLLPTKCLVWQAQRQLIKSHARAVTVREEQGVLFFLTLHSLCSSSHWDSGAYRTVVFRSFPACLASDEEKGLCHSFHQSDNCHWLWVISVLLSSTLYFYPGCQWAVARDDHMDYVNTWALYEHL